MTWNYRIIKEDDYYSVCEVFYKGKKPVGWSKPMTIGGENTDEILEQLEMIAKDINSPALEVKNNKLVAVKA
jgi:hypothetical protein